MNTIDTEEDNHTTTPRVKKKSRFLSTYELFEVLQIEYLCCILRARIYPKSKDKDYWNRVAEGKKTTILSISNRNHDLPNIFTDSDLESALSRRIYRENTYPTFVYRDETHKQNQEYLDLCYYYNKGVEVRFTLNDEMKVGKVKNYRPFNSTLEITYEGEDIKIPVSNCVRIL